MPTTPNPKVPNLREPWVFVPGSAPLQDFSIFGADGSELVESVQTTKADGFTAADVAAIGQMMAAAPEMHKALRMCIDALESVKQAFGNEYRALEYAKAVLAKTEGAAQ